MDTASREFSCAICGEVAGQVRWVTPADAVDESAPAALRALAELDVLERPDQQAALAVETFFGVASLAVPAERIGPVSRALAGTDASALYRIGYSYAPFYCPDCAASYCGAHWNWRQFDDDPYSGIEGDCPRGHFHILAY